jgi:DME family drug/metabolite transporter
LFFIVRTDFVKIDWEPQMVLVALFLGVFTMGLANILQIIGLSGIGPGVAATMMLADPVTAALLGILVMGEELTLIGGIGLSLVVIGLLLQGLIPGEPKNKKSVKTFS